MSWNANALFSQRLFTAQRFPPHQQP
jgi:hypothetical protein